MSGSQLTPSAEEISDAFCRFYTLFPRHEARADARKAFAAAVKKAGIVAILNGLEAQIAAGVFERKVIDSMRRGFPRTHFIKLPGTWLRAGCWEDEIETCTGQRPEFRNGALEALARQWEGGDGAPMLEGPAGD